MRQPADDRCVSVVRRVFLEKAMKPIGITGGAGEGKSTVLAMFRDEGLSVVSSDEVVRELMADSDFRSGVLAEIGLPREIDASGLRSRVLAEPSLRRRLNGALHRPVWSRLVASGAQVWEVPLLVEACLTSQFSGVVVVTCGETEQRQRLLARLGDARLVDRLLQAQLPTTAKLPFADFVIRTDCPTDHVHSHVKELVRRMKFR